MEMPKFEAKKRDFAKIWQKLGGYSPPPHPSRFRRPCPENFENHVSKIGGNWISD